VESNPKKRLKVQTLFQELEEEEWFISHSLMLNNHKQDMKISGSHRLEKNQAKPMKRKPPTKKFMMLSKLE